MSTVNVEIPANLKDYVADQVSKGKYRDEGEFIRQLVEEHRTRSVRNDVEKALLSALESPLEEMNDSDWAEIERRGDELLNKRQRQ